MADQPPLVLVDGNNLLWRSEFGFPARIRSRDKTRDVTGVFGFFALLRKGIRENVSPDPRSSCASTAKAARPGGSPSTRPTRPTGPTST
jgi:hypothetical protein